MEYTFKFRASDVGKTGGAAATSNPTDRASAPKKFGTFTLAFRSRSISTVSSTSSLQKLPASNAGTKRKRSSSETPEDERPAKKNYIPNRQVVLKGNDGLPVTFYFQGYNDPDTLKEEGLGADGIPADVDADIDDLVERDPWARYDHPWADIPGMVEFILEETDFPETAAIHDDTAESLYALAKVYAEDEGEYPGSDFEFSDDEEENMDEGEDEEEL
ncbi:hypothetical protein F5Y06DRAFT_57545 [Hypoxylon sp. FL0890]|nr:hypothetical protein F5Y06DRAFT_57545 [Hypoxylon sp. FL0890]